MSITSSVCLLDTLLEFVVSVTESVKTLGVNDPVFDLVVIFFVSWTDERDFHMKEILHENQMFERH